MGAGAHRVSQAGRTRVSIVQTIWSLPSILAMTGVAQLPTYGSLNCRPLSL